MECELTALLLLSIIAPVDNPQISQLKEPLHVPGSLTLDIPRSPLQQMSTPKPLTIELQAETNLTSDVRKQSIALPKSPLLNPIIPQCSSQLTQASFIYSQTAVTRQEDTITDKYSQQKTRSVHKEKPHDSTATDAVQTPRDTKTSQCHSSLQVLLSHSLFVSIFNVCLFGILYTIPHSSTLVLYVVPHSSTLVLYIVSHSTLILYIVPHSSTLILFIVSHSTTQFHLDTIYSIYHTVP